jgi:hypothetical protein
MLANLIDEAALTRPYILTSALKPLLRIAPDSGLTRQLIAALADCRMFFGDILLWPEKRVTQDQPLLAPSLVHTARAVTVFRDASDGKFRDDVANVEDWISRAGDLQSVSEVIGRHLDFHRKEETLIHHFTPAWFVLALSGGALPRPNEIARGLEQVWARYDDSLHLWAWSNGDAPASMLADATDALNAAALALLPVARVSRFP